MALTNIIKSAWKPVLIVTTTGLMSYNTYYLINLKTDQDHLRNEQILQKKMIPLAPSEKDSALEKKINEHTSMMIRRLTELENRSKNDHQDKKQQLKERKKEKSSSTDNRDLTAYLKSQIDAYQSNLHDNLVRQKAQLESAHALDLEDRIRRVENKYKPFVNKVNEIELSMERQNKVTKDIFEKELPSRLLWLACQNLMDKMKNNLDNEENRSVPLEQDPLYATIKDLAEKKNNALASTVLGSIPKKALSEGVCSEDILQDRFKKVDKICRRVAMIGSRGGNLTQHLLSYLQSLFILNTDIDISEELSGKKLIDPSSWDTFEVLARVRFCLSTHNLEQALRYANQLRGQARIVAKDWINDTRVHLETKHALSVLATQAEATALDMLYQSSSKIRSQVI